VGHREAFRAFARAAKRGGIRFMVIGGTFRDVAVRATSTRDIDIVLVDRKDVDERFMAEAKFVRLRGSRHAWRYEAGRRPVDLEIAAMPTRSSSRGCVSRFPVSSIT
jgi:hypothetical protein